MDGPSSKPNNLPHPNPGGKAATFSTQGEGKLTGEYFQAQGSTELRFMSYSGRSVEHQSRHFARLVLSNWWTHPIFNTLDANNASIDRKSTRLNSSHSQ